MDEDEAGGVNAMEGEPRAIRRAPFEAGEILDDPDDGGPAGRRGGPKTRSERESEAAGRRAIARSPRRDLMQGAPAQAAAQHPVEAAICAEAADAYARERNDIVAGDFLAQKSQPLRSAARGIFRFR